MKLSLARERNRSLFLSSSVAFLYATPRPRPFCAARLISPRISVAEVR